MIQSLHQNVIGIDVAKRKLDVFDSHDDQHEIILNEASAILDLVKRIKHSKRHTRVVMEATGGYERLLLEALHKHQIDCSVVNPLHIKNFMRGCGKLEKNDRIDARMIAFFGQTVSPKLQEKPS